MDSRRLHWAFTVLFLTATSVSVLAQKSASKPSTKTQPPPAKAETPAAQIKTAAWAEWDTLKPENEDFSILMPKDTKTEIEKFPFHKMELNARLYLSAATPAPVVAVASIAGIKSNPAAYTDFARFNSYVDAFKTFFPPKVRKDAVAKMILVAQKPFHGYTGRIYKLTVGDLSGTVNAYVTRKRFYAIAILNTTKDNALEEKFLSSFVIPDKPIDQPATNSAAATEVTLDQSANTGAEANNNGRRQPKLDGRLVNDNSSTAPGTGTNTGGTRASVNTQEDNTEYGTGTAQADAQQNQSQQTPKQRPPVQGGVLNGKAIYLPLPELPSGERPGVVMVQVLVDEQGSVIDAKVISGPPNLHGSAINVAKLARFLPTVLAGEPVRVAGTLAYNFARPN
jgi:hypothetical protein